MKRSNYSLIFKAYFMVVSIFTCLFFVGCSGSDGNTTNQKEYVYVPEYYEISSEEGEITSVFVEDDIIYYISTIQDEETQKFTSYLCTFHMES